jgi:hypothetical protein
MTVSDFKGGTQLYQGLTLIRHPLRLRLGPENMIAIPFTEAPLAKLWIPKVRLEVGYRAIHDVEVGKEECSHSSDSTDLHITVAEGPMLLDTANLVVLGIVC